MHRAEWLPGRDSITNFTMQDDANRRVDHIFLLFAPAPENYAGGPNRFAIHREHIAILQAVYVVRVFRARKFVRIVEGADVSSLQGNHPAKRFERLPRDYQPLGLQLALGDGIRSSAQMKHPAREFKTQFPEVVRPAPTQDVEHLDDFKRISYMRSERLIHVRDQCDH